MTTNRERRRINRQHRRDYRLINDKPVYRPSWTVVFCSGGLGYLLCHVVKAIL